MPLVSVTTVPTEADHSALILSPAVVIEADHIVLTSDVLEHKWQASLCTNEILQKNLSVHF